MRTDREDDLLNLKIGYIQLMNRKMELEIAYNVYNSNEMYINLYVLVSIYSPSISCTFPKEGTSGD